MNIAFLPILLLFIHYETGLCDLMRTVYCASKCTDYLAVPEDNIPKCLEQHLSLNQCGTVISCSWADVKLEKQRPVANETDDIICCYDVVLKEKGDCDSQQAMASAIKHANRISHSSNCLSQVPALFSVIAILIMLLAAQTFYIMWTCSLQRRMYNQKFGHVDESTTVISSQGPLLSSKPLAETRLLSFHHLFS